VLSGERTLEEILLAGPAGVKIVPATSGVKQMTHLSPAAHAGLIAAFSTVVEPVDVLLVDTAAGIAEPVTTFSRAAQEVVVVVCDEPASITDAYALIKVLSRDYDVRRFRIVANMVQTGTQGPELYGKLVKVANRFLDVTLDFMGAVPEDPMLRKAVRQQRAAVEAYPTCRASLAFKRLAEEVVRWPLPQGPSGRVEFFVERLVRPAAPLP
jgi:flagellar biosynthesis protein FlhG